MVESISVIIPTLNRKELTLAAVESCLGQTRLPDEILVVDNGSDDGTSTADFGPSVRVLTEARTGAGFARLTGLGASSSSHVLFLDSDDLLVPSALETLVKVMSASRADIAFGALRNFQDTSNTRVFGKEAKHPSGSTCLISSSIFDRFGFFEGHNYSFLVWIEAVRNAGAYLVGTEEVVCLRRIHESNMGFSVESRAFYLSLVRRRLENRRK